MKYVKQLTIILTISLIAELLRFLIPIPIPAGVYGMTILLILLCTKKVKEEQIKNTADFFIGIMGIMFIPAGVGMIDNFDAIISMLPAIAISVVLITVLVMLVSGKVTELFIKEEK